MSQKTKSNAVVVIYGAKDLYDFLWFYSTFGKEYNWTVIVGNYIKEGINLRDECKRSGIFETILFDEHIYKTMSLRKKIWLMIKMTFFFFVGKRDLFCKKVTDMYVPDYDLAVVVSDYGFLNGAFIAAGKEKDIVILEDGTGDYQTRYDRLQGNFLDLYNLAGYLCARMGYLNFRYIYKMPTTQYCVKYVKYPERILYRDYKCINKLGDYKNTDIALFQELLSRCFGELPKTLSADAILYTEPLYDFFEDDAELVNKCVAYINSNYAGKTIFLKKHPRDLYQYKFNDSVKVIMLDARIPAEAIADLIQTRDALFIGISTVMMLTDQYWKEGKVLHIKNATLKKGVPNYYDFFTDMKERLSIREEQIIELA